MAWEDSSGVVVGVTLPGEIDLFVSSELLSICEGDGSCDETGAVAVGSVREQPD